MNQSTTDKRTRFRWIFLGILIFIVSMFVVYKSILPAKPNLKKVMPDGEVALHAKGRTLLILIDSLRTDFCFNAKRMPFLNSLKKRGAWGISEVLSNPITISGDKSIFTGIIDRGVWALSEDFAGKPCSHDNLIQRLVNAGKKVVIFSSDSIRVAFGKGTDMSVYKPRISKFDEYNEEAKHVFKQSYNYLKNNDDWDFVVVQFVSVDFAGHLHTPRSKQFEDISRKVDSYVKKLVSLTNSNDTVLITSEHGMDDSGCHIDERKIVIDTPFILLGPFAKQEGPKHVYQIDWAPTLSLLTGVSPFYNTPALPALQCLNINNKHKIEKLLSKRIGVDQTLTFKEINRRRCSFIGVASQPILAILILISIASVMFCLFINLDLFKANKYILLKKVGVITVCIGVPIIIIWGGFWQWLMEILPFRADTIIRHPFLALLLVMCAVIPPVIIHYLLKIKSRVGQYQNIFLFSFYCIIAVSVLMYENPYYPMCWGLVCMPIAAFMTTYRPAWLLMFSGIISGFILRRLTFIEISYPTLIPSHQSVLWGLTITAMFLFIAWKKLNNCKFSNKDIFLLLLICTPPLTSFSLLSPFLRAISLIFVSLAMLFLLKQERSLILGGISYCLPAFLIATSSTTASLSMLVAFPLLLSFALLITPKNRVMNGIAFVVVYWGLYVISGNTFDLTIVELHDSFLMNSIVAQSPMPNIFVMASHYILPIIALFAILYIKTERNTIVQSFSVIASPFIAASSLLATWLIYAGADSYPTLTTHRLLVYTIFTLIVFISVALIICIDLFIHKSSVLKEGK